MYTDISASQCRVRLFYAVNITSFCFTNNIIKMYLISSLLPYTGNITIKLLDIPYLYILLKLFCHIFLIA